jgi:hypothetical protein
MYFLLLFGLITILAWQFTLGRLVLYPFTLLGTWFHEMGHGLTAMLLGGDFQQLVMYPNGSGVAYYSGSIMFWNIGRAIVAAAGPMGPTIAGALLIMSSRSRSVSRLALLVLSLILFISALFWVRPLFAFLLIATFGGIILLITMFGPDIFQKLTVQFLGVQACASVYQSIGYLFISGGTLGDQQFVSDTGVIAQNLFLPHWFWAIAIILFSIFLIYTSIKLAYRR